MPKLYRDFDTQAQIDAQREDKATDINRYNANVGAKLWG